MRRFMALMLGSRLRRNSAAAALQAVVGMVATFATYRLVIGAVGLEVFGLWSVLLAGAAVARMADVSGGSGLARFVAECLGKGRSNEAVGFVHTTVLSTIGLMSTGCLVVLAVAPPLVRYIGPGMSDAVIALLPVVLGVSVLLPAVSAVLCAAIDGTLRADLRAALMSASYGVLFATSLALVGILGIHGFAVALAAQHLFLMIGAWLVLRRQLPDLGWFPRRWSTAALRKSFGFGLRVQATTLASLLSDPLARLLIANEGGVIAAGVYDLALRLVQQLRGLFVAAMQPLMPQVAALADNPEQRGHLIARALRLAALASVVFVALSIVAAPLYARLMLGSPEPDLVLYAVLLSAGYGASLIVVPLFFAAWGRGITRWNLSSQFVTAGCITTLGPLIAVHMGATGIVIGQLAGLLAGAAAVGVGNARALDIQTQLRGSLPLILASLMAIATLMVLGLWGGAQWHG